MDDSVRTLRWSDDIFKFPCGIKVEMNKNQLIKLLTMFKLEAEIDTMVSTGKITISKGKAFQIRSYLV